MRVILSAITKAIPGIMWSAILLLLFYYVYGIIETVLFGKTYYYSVTAVGASSESGFSAFVAGKR